MRRTQGWRLRTDGARGTKRGELKRLTRAVLSLGSEAFRGIPTRSAQKEYVTYNYTTKGCASFEKLFRSEASGPEELRG